MSQVSIIRADAAPELAPLRAAIADASASVYGAKIRYAESLNLSFGVTLSAVEVTDLGGNVVDLQPEVSGWFDVEHGTTGEAAKPILAEKDALYAVLKASKHSNPSKVWADVRAYGRADALKQAEGICLAEIKARQIVMPEGSTRPDPLAPDARGANNKKSLRLRMIDDLSVLFAAAKRDKGIGTAEAAALVHISSALVALGVDLATLTK